MINIKGVIANYPAPVNFTVEPCGYNVVVWRLSHPGDMLGGSFHNPWAQTWSKRVPDQVTIDRELLRKADLVVSTQERWEKRSDGDVRASIGAGLGIDVLQGEWVNVPCHIDGDNSTSCGPSNNRGWVKPKGFEKPMWVSLSLEAAPGVDTRIQQAAWVENRLQEIPQIDIISNPWQASTTPVSVFGRFYGSGLDAFLRAHGNAINTTGMKPQASIMQANCGGTSKRGEIVYAMNRVDKETIANLGICWGGVPGVPQHLIYTPEGALLKLKLLKQYMFSLVLESAIQEDYITEKSFQALVMGSVPIYRGAPNAVLDYFPCDHCVIYYDDFKGPEELTYYLHYLNWNRSAYDEYHQWRHRRA